MERITRLRVGIILALFSLVVVLFAFKLYDLQIIETGGRVDNTKTFTTITTVKAARGEILDCNGNVLVTNRASYDMVFNHYVICSAADTNGWLLKLVELCRELDIDYIDHFPVSDNAPFTYTLTEYSSTWQGYFQSYLLKKGGLDSDITAPLLMKKLRDKYAIPEDWSDADARAVIGIRYELDLRQDVTNLPNFVFLEDAGNEELAALSELSVPGLKAEASTVREYNTEYAAHILGYIGPITADQWAETYKEKDGYAMDALVGQEGLEEAFEEYLHATDGVRVDVVTVDGTVVESYYKKDADGNEMRPVAGQNVELSIDINLQTTAEVQMAALITALRESGENLAEGAVKPDGSDAEGGAVVVMNVKTGQILACASYPTYNLSTFREDYNELKETPYAPLYNRALLATYPPGSTYKMSVAIAAIDTGLINSQTIINDEGVFKKYEDTNYAPKCLQYTNYGYGHGKITVLEAIRDSCNYFFYDIGDRMDIDDMDAVAKGLGLGESTGVELFEYTGHRANEETKASLYSGDGGRWYAADQVSAAIGQSDNRFTPLQLCVYTCTLANRGTRYRATFLNRIISSDYTSVVEENEPEIVSKYEISDEAYYAYTEGMRLVATEGTARNIFGKNYPIEVAAKTGTAQTDAGTKYSDNGAFICYAPMDDPEIAIVVYGEKAGHGTTVGQIAKAIMDAYFNDEIYGESTSSENQIN